MTLMDLLDKLEGVRGSYDGEEETIPVFCTSDHGQDYEDVFSVDIGYCLIMDSEVDRIHPDDLQDYVDDGNELIKAIFIN